MYSSARFILYFSNVILAPNEVTLEISTLSKLDCARLCTNGLNTSSFFYNADTQTCIPSTKRYLTMACLSPEPGYMYYISQRDCGADWSVSSGQCYLFITDHKTAEDAKTTCEGLGGFLAKADDDIDNTVIKSFVGRYQATFWIDGGDAVKEGTWLWVDGCPISPLYWEADQPDEYYEDEDCIEQRENGWNDFNCGNRLPFLCEK